MSRLKRASRGAQPSGRGWPQPICALWVLLVVLSSCGLPGASTPSTAAPEGIQATAPPSPTAPETREAQPIATRAPTATATESTVEEIQIVTLPPPGQLYHAVHPGGPTGEEDDITSDGLRSYETLAGKSTAWVYFSHNWYRNREFPWGMAEWIREAGSVPYIRLMLRSDAEQGSAEPTFTLARIIEGEFDDDLRAWAQAARDFGSPLIAEYGTEVNGEWFSWNGVWNGAGTLDEYGDPAEPDGPERFRDAYRHIVELCREEGAENIVWVFHANNQDIPDEGWNRLEAYYPGDEWIDWIGVSVYGAQTPMDEEWPEFRDMLDEVYPRLAALSPDRPIVVLEFGVTAGNSLGDPADWAERALADLIGLRWPRVIGFSWWNEAWPNDGNPDHDTTMRLQDNPALAEVFQQLVGDNPDVLGEAVIAARPAP